MKKSEIHQRRLQVSYMLLKGFSEIEISKELGLHRNTICNDVSSLKDHAQSWLNGLAKDGFIFAYHATLNGIVERQLELEELKSETRDTLEKIQIIKTQNESAKLFLELIGESPTVHAFRKALRKTEETRNVQTA